MDAWTWEKGKREGNSPKRFSTTPKSWNETKDPQIEMVCPFIPGLPRPPLYGVQPRLSAEVHAMAKRPINRLAPYLDTDSLPFVKSPCYPLLPSWQTEGSLVCTSCRDRILFLWKAILDLVRMASLGGPNHPIQTYLHFRRHWCRSALFYKISTRFLILL